MSLFQLFNTTKPNKKTIEKQVSKLKERYSQSEYRKIAMQKLLKWNTKESIEGVLKRFKIVAQSPYWDENEKKWLLNKLKTKGNIAKTALISFLNTSDEVTHTIIALNNICKNNKEFIEILLHALKKRSPENYNFTQSKKEIIFTLNKYKLSSKFHILIPYINDYNDDIKCAIIDNMLNYNYYQFYKYLIKIISQSTSSTRVLLHAAQTIYKLKIILQNNIILQPEISKTYIIQNNKLKIRNL